MMRDLEHIVNEKTNLESLAFSQCRLPNRQGMSLLLCSPPSLRSLEVELPTWFDAADPHLGLEGLFVGLLESVAQSNLECLTIGCFSTDDGPLQLLIDGIPTMRLKTLDIRMNTRLKHRKGNIIRAVKGNPYLLSFVGKFFLAHGRHGNFFTKDECDKLQSYAVRNARRIAFIANPWSAPKGAWAHALSSAYGTSTGPETVFQMCRAIESGLQHDFPE